MGKQGRGQGSWQQGGWYPQPSWSASVWQGAKRQWENRQPSLNFPAYDSDWTSGRTETIAVIEERRFDQEQPKTRTAAVQHALNHARKIDTRLLKLQREQVQKAEQWNAYQQGMKAAYNKEKLRHEKALQRIDSDIAAALEAQEEAQVMVEQAALQFGQAQPRMEVDDTAWDSLMRTRPEPSITSTDDVAADLRAYLAERHQTRTMEAKQAAGPAPLGAADGQTARSMAANTKTYNAMSPHATAAPMPAAQVGLPEKPPTAAPNEAPPDNGEDTGDPKPHRPKPTEQRKPVKGAPLKVAHPPSPSTTSLSDKLASKRAAMLQVEAATRAAKGELGQDGQEGPPGLSVAAEAQIIQDDDFEDLEEVDRPPKPGLTAME